MGRRRSSSWHQRSSILSTWEHSFVIATLDGALYSDLGSLIKKDGVEIHSGLSPMIIPRACRLTRVAILLRFSAATFPAGSTFDFIVSKSTGCSEDLSPFGPVYEMSELLESGGFGYNCLCFDVSYEFDRCDIWNFTLFLQNLTGGGSPSIQNPVARILTHWELR